MRPVAVAPLNGLVRDEPGVAAAAQAAGSAAPRADFRLVLIGDTGREPIETGRPGWREVEDELVTVVHIAIAVDRLLMADRGGALQGRICTRPVPLGLH